MSTSQGSLCSPRLRVLCGSLWGRTGNIPLLFALSEINLLHHWWPGQCACTLGTQRQAAPLGEGSKGNSLLLEEITPFHEDSCSSFLPSYLSSSIDVCGKSEEVFVRWVMFSAQTARKHPWENDRR